MSANIATSPPPGGAIDAAPARSPLQRGGRLVKGQGVTVLLLILILVGWFSTPDFMTTFNIDSVLRQAAIIGVLAMGQFVVIVNGGFDLSVGAVAALASMIVAKLGGDGAVLAMLLAILAGMGVGLISGIAVARFAIPAFVATLAVMGIARAFAFQISERGIPVMGGVFDTLANGKVGPLPVPALIWLLLIIGLHVMLRQTAFGMHLFAVGGDETSTRLAGVPVRRIKIWAYVISGGLAAVGGILYAARSYSGLPTVGAGWELDTIAAVVIGGVSLGGGEGSLLKAMVGVLIYVLIGNIMNLTGVDPNLQNVVGGAIIFVVVAAPLLMGRRQRLSAEGGAA